MKVYFVRHGQSVANVNDLEQGPDEPLSDLGREQAAFVAKRLAGLPVTRLIASPYARANETAEIIRETLGLPLAYSELFVERKPPTELIGKPGDGPEYRAAREKWEKERRVDPSWRYSDEETFTELKDRALAALAYLVDENADGAAVVTHAGFLKVMLGCMIFGERYAYAMHVDVHNAFKTKNTGITLVEYKNDPNPFHGGWSIHAWNDHAHL